MALTLTRASWTATLRPAQGLVMSDTPTQRGPPARPDRVLAAHERRARLIAQLHRQAIATANDLLTQRKAIEAGHAKDAQRRKTEAWLIAAGAIIVALGCILALWLVIPRHRRGRQ